MLRWIWNIINFILDVADIFGFIGIGAGVWALILFLQNLSVAYPISLTVVAVLFMTINFIRWLRLKELRKECFNISVLLENMHNRMTEIAKEKAPSVRPAKCLGVLEEYITENETDCMALYEERATSIIDKELGINSVLIRSIKNIINKIMGMVKHTARLKRDKARIIKLVVALDKQGIGIKQDVEKDGQYKSLNAELIKAFRYCSDDKIRVMKEEYLEISYLLNSEIILMSCFARQRQLAKMFDFKTAEIFYLDNLNKVMGKEMVKIEKRILKHWKEG